MNNHPEIINREYPAEDIRTIPDNGIIEKPFPLREADYDKLTNKGFFPSSFYLILALFFGQLISIAKVYLEYNFESIKYSDKKILAILFILLLAISIISYHCDKDKKYIKKLIKEHFLENRLGIEEQRKIYGRKK
jgi:hypothetical protein